MSSRNPYCWQCSSAYGGQKWKRMKRGWKRTLLRITSSQHPHTWSSHLVWIKLAHNFLPSTSTGFLPFHIIHGHPLSDSPVPSALSLIKSAWQQARQHLLRWSATYKAAVDKKRSMVPSSATGQKAWQSTRNLRVESRKLEPRLTGPCSPHSSC